MAATFFGASSMAAALTGEFFLAFNFCRKSPTIGGPTMGDRSPDELLWLLAAALSSVASASRSSPVLFSSSSSSSGAVPLLCRLLRRIDFLELLFWSASSSSCSELELTSRSLTSLRSSWFSSTGAAAAADPSCPFSSTTWFLFFRFRRFPPPPTSPFAFAGSSPTSLVSSSEAALATERLCWDVSSRISSSSRLRLVLVSSSLWFERWSPWSCGSSSSTFPWFLSSASASDPESPELERDSDPDRSSLRFVVSSASSCGKEAADDCCESSLSMAAAARVHGNPTRFAGDDGTTNDANGRAQDNVETRKRSAELLFFSRAIHASHAVPAAPL